MAIFALNSAVLADVSPLRDLSISTVRDYGIVMGETVTGEIRAAVAQGYELQTAALPLPGSAISDHLELRDVRWSKETLGDDSVYRIALTYQVFKGVREPETLTVPALRLRFDRGGQSFETEVPAWHFTLSPLIAPAVSDEAVKLRGDLPPPVYSSVSHWRGFSAFLAGLAGLSLYAAWRLGLPPFRRNATPFFLALRGLKKLSGQAPGVENHRQALRLVHRALDETAGHVLFAAELDRFLQAHAHYEVAREELAGFFALSERLFFAAGEPDVPQDALSRLQALCRTMIAAGSGKR
ncbi:MAG: hypothetical protein PHE55_14720 [Methylococcaceae bacterium]|nr:hypothetical protein [Methylococcaceae bacterium]